jgi:hypothetical protein
MDVSHVHAHVEHVVATCCGSAKNDEKGELEHAAWCHEKVLESEQLNLGVAVWVGLGWGSTDRRDVIRM